MGRPTGKDTTVLMQELSGAGKVPTLKVSAEGFSEMTSCIDGKKTERTMFDLDEKTPTGHILWKADGTVEMTSFAADGKTPTNLCIRYADGRYTLTNFREDGKTPKDFTELKPDGSSVETDFDRNGKARPRIQKSLR
jgi:hypothetical protein